jgi:integrase
MALTELQVRNAKPQVKSYKLSDSGGLFLLITPSGGRLWRYKYRYNGKEKLLAMGAYPDIGLKDAREKHAEARKILAQGVDPSEKRKEAKAEKIITFRLWAKRWHLHWAVGKSPRHAGYVERRLEADIYPVIGDMAITAITTPDVVRTIKKIAERGALDMATRSHQTIGQIFRYAIAHGDESNVTRNPASDIQPSDIIESRRKVNYARVDIKELPTLLRAIEAANISTLTRLAIKLMSLTFVRTSELIGGRWNEVDFITAQWRIPAERMKMKSPHIVPLSSQTVELLKILKINTGNGDLMFPSQVAGKNGCMSNNTILVALGRMGYKGLMTGHGFRGIASTALHEQGFDHKHIELQLAHAERNQVSASYNHALYLKQRVAMMQHWADYLDTLKSGAEYPPKRPSMAESFLGSRSKVRELHTDSKGDVAKATSPTVNESTKSTPRPERISMASSFVDNSEALAQKKASDGF